MVALNGPKLTDPGLEPAALTEALLQATEQLLAQYGPDGVTELRIASRAGVSLDVLRQTFPVKDVLVAQAMARQQRDRAAPPAQPGPRPQMPTRPAAPGAAPSGARPVAPPIARPGAPATARPAVPAAARPHAPSAGRPAAPAVARPHAPSAGRPVAPAVARPHAPSAGRPVAPLIARPTTPSGARPAAPTAARPGAAPAARPPAAPGARPPAAPAARTPAPPPASSLFRTPASQPTPEGDPKPAMFRLPQEPEPRARPAAPAPAGTPVAMPRAPTAPQAVRESLEDAIAGVVRPFVATFASLLPSMAGMPQAERDAINRLELKKLAAASEAMLARHHVPEPSHAAYVMTLSCDKVIKDAIRHAPESFTNGRLEEALCRLCLDFVRSG